MKTERTDRELLELAAKAAGFREMSFNYGSPLVSTCGENDWTAWNPLTDDGDALRLAVKLRMTFDAGEDQSEAVTHFHWYKEMHGPDPMAATRRAIVRAAAEIGESMGGADGSANNATN